ncbi:hypothetical protein G5V57_17770 [Nordella sp. HKS 07]|uniref:hypothetical protein n=1 Tax=Nordella sp. HKS 07 TaxID=2712222 RepID=UPI0013E1E728|nr:hypothetical protein [Nordella sp. HKS 07]QIG49402.1 hypothetical protein G5V57_17770 [Nordella sp. HKS 07]
MTLRFAIKEMAAVMLALCMLTIIPAASSSFKSYKSRPAPGGFSEIHKNGNTPLWMLSAYEREVAGI